MYLKLYYYLSITHRMDMTTMEAEQGLYDVKINLWAVREAEKRTLVSYYETLIRNGDYTHCNPKMAGFLSTARDAIKSIHDPMLQDFTYVWLTITPEACHGFDEHPQRLIDLTTKFLNGSKYFKEWRFVVEQRAETLDTVHGVHIHILIKREDKCTHARYNQQISRYWAPYHGAKYKFFMGNKMGAVYYKDNDFAEKKEKYMAGEKDTEHKQALVSVDKLWRTKLGLDELYESPFLINRRFLIMYDNGYAPDQLDKLGHPTVLDLV
jgi:hypothetical protein